MSIYGECIPTHKEAVTLASQVPPKFPLAAEKALDILDDVVARCKVSFVHNFLFTEDPIDLQHIADPNALKNGVLGTVSATRIEPSAAISKMTFSEHIQGSYMLVPAFSVDNFSLGFAVYDHLYRHITDWDKPVHQPQQASAKVQARFVMDDDTGSFMNIFEVPQADFLRIELTHAFTPTYQIRSTLRFNRTKFRALLKAGNFHRYGILDALESLQTMYEYRACPLCSSNHGGCMCRLPIIKSRHAFDHDAFKQNVSLWFGTFTGIANRAIYAGGQHKRAASMGCRLKIGHEVDMRMISAIQEWAAHQQHARGEDPRHSLVSVGVFDDNITDDTNAMSAQDPLRDSFDNGSISDYLFNENGAAPHLQERDQGFMQISNGSAVMEDSWQLANGLAEFVSSRVSADSVDMPWKRPKHDQEKDAALREFLHQSSEEGQPRRAPKLIESPKRTEKRQKTKTSPSQASRCTSGGKSDKSGAEEENDMIRKLKAELRKERNRASAQRSNFKRKAMNDARKQEIRNNREKAELLRGRELLLRQENMRLRQELEMSGLPAPAHLLEPQNFMIAEPLL